MKTLYLECKMGAAGDMLMAALYELLPNQAEFLEIMNRLVEGVQVKADKRITCGISGTHMSVTVNEETEVSEDLPCGAINKNPNNSHQKHHHHHPSSNHGNHSHSHSGKHENHNHTPHRSPLNIKEIIRKLPLPEPVKENAWAVYDRIAEAESKAHGVPVTEVHFHEVGALDAIIDITGVCLALHLIQPDQIIVSPIHLGSGQVRCAHGVMPVPTPATVNLLEGIPCYSGEIVGELCTPTGAALLAHFGDDFASMPVMRILKNGYGVGSKQFSAPNCVRAFLGESGDQEQAEIIELCCHIDDMTAEALAYASDELMSQGALDVAISPLTMKKGRPGVSFTVLCSPSDEERLAQSVLRQTNTNGVRSRRCRKFILNPSIKKVMTSYGEVRIKCADGLDFHREKPEYEDVARFAEANDLPFQKVWNDIIKQI